MQSVCSRGRRGRGRQVEVGKYLVVLLLVIINIGGQLLVGVGVVLRGPGWLCWVVARVLR